MNFDAPLLLPLGQMARHVRVTSEWLKDEADAGRVPCLRASKRYLFAPDAVERVLAERAGGLIAGIDNSRHKCVFQLGITFVNGSACFVRPASLPFVPMADVRVVFSYQPLNFIDCKGIDYCPLINTFFASESRKYLGDAKQVLSRESIQEMIDAGWKLESVKLLSDDDTRRSEQFTIEQMNSPEMQGIIKDVQSMPDYAEPET